MSSASGAGGGGGLLVAILLVVVIGPTSTPAKSAQSDVFLEVKPDTVAPGQHLELRAGCDDGHHRPATVSSRAFGEVTLVARAGADRLTGSVTVPTETRPGDYRVTLHCPGGDTARAKLEVIDKTRPKRGPDTGGGGTAADATDDRATGGGPALLAGVGMAALITGSLLLSRRRRAG